MTRSENRAMRPYERSEGCNPVTRRKVKRQTVKQRRRARQTQTKEATS